VTVDAEAGYSDDPEQTGALVSAILDAGAVGINLEDGAAAPASLAAKTGAAKRVAAAIGADLFVNARTDVFLKRLVPPERAIDETIARARRYREAGADGIFVPGLIEPAAIRSIAEQVELPLNVMVGAGLPPLSVLRNCGVRRVSAGASLCRATFGAARQAIGRFLSDHQYDQLLERAFAQAELNAMFARS
jgi:2-methylisocitrate lyase-like PEP mutase family enzyme